MDYKNHRIEVSVRSVSDGNGWKPDVYVTYSENGKNVLKSLRIDRTFVVPDEAEQARVEYAKKWIDDGNRTKASDPLGNRAKMDELARKYVETRDPKIREES